MAFLSERSDYPTLNAPTADLGGAVLTPELVDRFRNWIMSDEYREGQREAEAERFRQMDALNLQLKTDFAASLGKTVEQLTKKDMQKLNERCFQSWLEYKGVTEQEFWD